MSAKAGIPRIQTISIHRMAGKQHIFKLWGKDVVTIGKLSLEKMDHKWPSPIVEFSGKRRPMAMLGNRPENLRTKM